MPHRRVPIVPAPLMVLGGVASVQVGSAFAATLFDELGAAGITLLRLGIGSLLLFVVLRPRVRRWTRPAWRAAVVLGVTMGCMNLVFYLAISRIPLGIAVTVEFLGPLLLGLAQTRRLIDLLWALLAFSGVLLLGLDSSGDAALGGLALAFTAGLLWAGYIVASARLGQVLPGTDGLAVALAAGTLVVLPFGLSGAAAVVDHPQVIAGAVVVALMSSVIPYGLELSALRRLSTRVFSILMSLEPAAAAIAGFFVLDQLLGPVEILALVLVVLASLGVTLARRDAGE